MNYFCWHRTCSCILFWTEKVSAIRWCDGLAVSNAACTVPIEQHALRRVWSALSNGQHLCACTCSPTRPPAATLGPALDTPAAMTRASLVSALPAVRRGAALPRPHLWRGRPTTSAGCGFWECHISDAIVPLCLVQQRYLVTPWL
jgi:hypothetical protein